MLAVKENALGLPQRPPSSPHPCGTHESLPALMRWSAWSDSSRDCQDGLCVLTTVLHWPSQAGLGGLAGPGPECSPAGLCTEQAPDATHRAPQGKETLLEPQHKDENKRVSAGWKPDRAGSRAMGRWDCRQQLCLHLQQPCSIQLAHVVMSVAMARARGPPALDV